MLQHYDFAAAWTAHLRQHNDPRLDPAIDRAFWERYAVEYDRQAGSVTQCLELVRHLLHPDDTLLDIGAGTGRFALPIARLVRAVTALDQSSAMLSILSHRAAQQGITNLRLLEADWPDVIVEPHDVTLAAWSLYRQLDLATALQQMAAVTRRLLIIIDSVASDPPHRSLIEHHCGGWHEARWPHHLLIAGALWQQGLLAEVRIVNEECVISGSSPEAIVRQMVSTDTPASIVTAMARDVTPLLVRHADGWRYAYRQPVGVVIWQTHAQ
ncbi:class I SAM-dependent methyltransferase [Chloroflexus sp.]|uniref:class I SAM-dependent methyltransferase n=1 Tax=Chloroflexus sp. TaxID=1904827 RepID=UPI002ACEDA1E|nr:class I SAM-dependent methyltransferase [Chloroflexus sp.]